MLKTFKTFVIALAVIEAASLVGFFIPAVREMAFFAVLVIALIAALQHLRYGVYMLFAELAVGSKGYLLWYTYDGFDVSLRLGLFFIVMCVWAGKMVMVWMSAETVEDDIDPFLLKGKTWKELPKQVRDTVNGFSRKRTGSWGVYGWYGLLFVALAWGAGYGYAQGNGAQVIFLDANGWLYFALIFPFIYIINQQVGEKKHDQWLTVVGRGLAAVLAAGVAWLSVKTLLLLYIFSHNLPYAAEIYRWVRVTGVGEITRMDGGFHRVFIQSHLWILIALFGMLAAALWLAQHKKYRQLWYWVLPLLVVWSVVVLSFSRSFWAGLGVGLVVYGMVSFGLYWRAWRAWLIHAGIAGLAGVASLGLVWGIVAFPIPNSTARFNADLLKDRTTDISTEDAVSSRWQLLPVLWGEIRQAPVLGKGFGEAVTYISNDPRVREQNASGEYTTTAFEWGWLDMWLKLGALGIVAYGGLLGYVTYYLVRLALKTKDDAIRLPAVAALGALVFVVATHAVSPYLNHPLGIGFVVAVSVWTEGQKRLVIKKK